MSFVARMAAEPDLARSIRRLRPFLGSIALWLAHLRQQGIRAAADEPGLARVFVLWRAGIDAGRLPGRRNRRDYALFAGGLMLRLLQDEAPLRLLQPRPQQPSLEVGLDRPLPLTLWPEAALDLGYALAMVAAVLAQEGMAPLRLDPAISDPEAWAEFRAAVTRDPAAAQGWFDRFCGVEPDWTFPAEIAMRPALRPPAPG